MDAIQSVKQLPDQTGTWDDEKYILTLRYFAGCWNPYIYGIGSQFSDTKVNGATVDDTRFVPFYLRNVSYIMGTQANADYAFFNLDLRGNQTNVPMFRGLDVKKYFDYYHGYNSQMIEGLDKIINVSAYSQNALSLKKETLDAAKFAIQSKSILDIIQMYTGYKFMPVNRDFESMEQADKYFQSFQEAMEVAYQDIAKNIVLTNMYRSKLLKPIDTAFLGGRGIMEVYHHNGNIYWHPIDLVNAIYDMSKNEDQHENDDYGGEIKMYPATYVISRWGEKLKAKYGEGVIKEIENVAKSGAEGWQPYNTLIGYNGLYWFNNVYNVPHIGVLRMQWRSLRMEDGDYVETLREGTLIGNKWLCEEGETVGQVYNKYKRSQKKLRYRTFSPSTLLGTNLGLGGIICRYADLKDALTTKMIKMVANSMGKVGFIRASKMPAWMKTPDIISDLKQNSILVINDADIDEEDSDKNTRIAESLDLTLDPNIVSIMNLIQYFDNVIADMINMPPNIRGIPTSKVYEPQKVAEQNQQQATLGMEYYYSNIRQWITGLIEYSADLAKTIWPESQTEHLQLVVGDATTKLLAMDVVKKMQFEDFMLSLDFSNVIDEKERQEYRELVKAFAMQGNPMYKLSDLVKIDTFDTKSEVGNYIESIEYKFEKKQEQIRKQEMAMQEKQMELNNETQKQISQTTADAGLQKTDITTKAKLLDTIIKKGSENKSQ